MTRALVAPWRGRRRNARIRAWDPRAAHVSGPICNPAANPPPPKDAVPIGNALTPAMRAACVKLAYDGSVPIGHEERVTIDGVRVVLWTSCHSYTVNADGSQTPGAYHGCSVYRDTSPIAPRGGGGMSGGAMLGALAALAAAAVVAKSWGGHRR